MFHIICFYYFQEIDKLQEEAESNKKKEKFIPATNYKDKYKHLIGEEAAVDAARQTTANRSYGFGKIVHYVELGEQEDYMAT